MEIRWKEFVFLNKIPWEKWFKSNSCAWTNYTEQLTALYLFVLLQFKQSIVGLGVKIIFCKSNYTHYIDILQSPLL